MNVKATLPNASRAIALWLSLCSPWIVIQPSLAQASDSGTVNRLAQTGRERSHPFLSTLDLETEQESHSGTQPIQQGNPASHLPAHNLPFHAADRVANRWDAQSPEHYRLGRGDRIQLNVFNNADYSKDYQVLADGTVNLPLVGTVSVGGLSLQQAADRITARYAEYIRTPSITLDLAEARPVQIAIAGQVNRPGAYTIPENLRENITLTQAIELAGGIAQSADIRQVQVLRQPSPIPSSVPPLTDGTNLTDSTNLAANVPTLYTVSLWDLLVDGDLSQDIALIDGDTIVVPAAATLAETEVIQLASASFSPETITVYVVGEVSDPGPVELEPNTPLNQAILAAGGFNSRAIEGEVSLVRLNPNGTVSHQAIAIDFDQNLDREQNPPLRQGDTIVIQPSGLAQTSDFANLVLPPLGGILNLLNLFFN